MEKLKGQKDIAYILGTSESLQDTPWNTKNADYLACWPVLTQPCAQGMRIDKVFELHEERTWKNYESMIKEYHERFPNTIFYMQREYPGLEFAKTFPLDKIQDSIPNQFLKRYFTNTMAYMIAYAVMTGYKVLNLFGINLCVEEEEYSMQRACAEAWLGYAIGKGVTINIAQPSALLANSYMYGYEGHKDVQIKLVQTKEQIKLGVEELEKRFAAVKEDLDSQKGSLRMAEYLIREFR